MNATKNAHDWHCKEHDTYGWRGESCCMCPEVPSEVECLRQQLDAAWAQAHRLALELECLIMDTKDNAVVSKWWDSAFEAIEEYQSLKPGADEESEAWAKMRKVGL